MSHLSQSVLWKNPTPGYCDGIEYYNLDDQFRNKNFANDGTDELCDDTSVSESLQSPDWRGPSWYRCVLFTLLSVIGFKFRSQKLIIPKILDDYFVKIDCY